MYLIVMWRNLGLADEASNHDHCEDSDFRTCQWNAFEEYESFLLDDEGDLELENESLDDTELGVILSCA